MQKYTNMINLMIGAVLVALVVWFFVRNTRRKLTPEETSVTLPNYKQLLASHINYYRQLSVPEKNRFEVMVANFLNDVNIEGVGLDINDEDRIMIAASAIIPIFGFERWTYKNLTNVILYPDTFNNDFQFEGESRRNILGMVGSGYMNGQMILSRAALQKGFSANSGKENAAIHEFVHLIDGADGAIDGNAMVANNEASEPWLQMMHSEMHRINEGKSDINPYAATNEAEFLAVASEYFFEKPAKFKEEHPDLYAALSEIFDQQPK